VCDNSGRVSFRLASNGGNPKSRRKIHTKINKHEIAIFTNLLKKEPNVTEDERNHASKTSNLVMV